MRLKTLLLGSATAFVVAGGSAQAADLSVAEPVDYVRVCDAFGAGYWYIPGTDTCIAIGGKVTFEVTFFEEDVVDDHTGSWDFDTGWDINVTTKSMTDWGPLTTFVNLTRDSGTSVSSDEHYLSIGPLLLGRTQSSFDVVGGGYAWNGLDLSDDKINQVQLSWAINGFGLILALEEPTRWESSETRDLPDLVAAITAGGSGWDAKVAFLYADLQADSQIGVQGSLEFEFGPTKLQLGALWAENGGNPHTGSTWVAEDGWAVLASWRQDWSPNMYSGLTGVYFDDDARGGTGWGVEFSTSFLPADGLEIGVAAGYSDVEFGGETWLFTLFAERTFGP